MTIDTTGWALDDFRAAISDLHAGYAAAENKAQAEVLNRRARVGAAIAELETLRGPAEGEPGTDSIRAVLRYDDQTLADHSGVALRLVLTGMEMLTGTVLNLAHIIAADK